MGYRLGEGWGYFGKFPPCVKILEATWALQHYHAELDILGASSS